MLKRVIAEHEGQDNKLMCGFVGYVDPMHGFHANVLSICAIRSAIVTGRRRPVDGRDRTGGRCLAHRRLSIIDTRSVGQQPMVSASGHVVIAFNGEFMAIELPERR